MPAKLSIDAGRDAAAELAEWRAGLKTAQDHYGARGLDHDEQQRQWYAEIAARKSIAAELGLSAQDIATFGGHGLVPAPVPAAATTGDNDT
ncbi:MAG: hypothetical protein CFK52_15210 [Chloracidobacterium sp. CP2_5A]|nr:MAG: hypothetical protein CFK52_15210 [Chloracidobacterium sp. CP2_5A]